MRRPLTFLKKFLEKIGIRGGKILLKNLNLVMRLLRRRDLQVLLLLRLLPRRDLLRLLLVAMALGCLRRDNPHVLRASGLWEFLDLQCHLALRPPTSTSSAWRTALFLEFYEVFDFYKLLV